MFCCGSKKDALAATHDPPASKRQRQGDVELSEANRTTPERASKEPEVVGRTLPVPTDEPAPQPKPVDTPSSTVAAGPGPVLPADSALSIFHKAKLGWKPMDSIPVCDWTAAVLQMSGCTDESELELPDDQEFALGLVIDFHLSAADKLEEMSAALTAWNNGKRPAGDASVETLLRSHAHAIKGTAANMGFLRYTEMAKRIELPFKSLLELKDFDGEILQAGASPEVVEASLTHFMSDDVGLMPALVAEHVAMVREFRTNLLRQSHPDAAAATEAHPDMNKVTPEFVLDRVRAAAPWMSLSD